MKLVIAYIKPDMLEEVIRALHAVRGIRGASICEGRGYGAWRMDLPAEAVRKEGSNYRPHIRVEVICSDEVAVDALGAITTSARTGLTGDGVAFMLHGDTCMRISTGEADDRLE